MKKVISLILSSIMVLSCFAIGASAAETGKASAGTTGTFTVYCQNVAGLPDVSFITGGDAKDVPENQRIIGKFIEDHGYDIVAVQEDFGYHSTLVESLPSYKYQTVHHGMVPSGDGTNIYTKSFKMYNEKHIVWDKLYGLVNEGADEFSQKGITYCCIEVADGVLVDFYNIHADAYGGEGSKAARVDNFRQLQKIINERTVKNPVIITGDLNEYCFGSYTAIREIFCTEMGMKDAWIELCNEANYETDQPYIDAHPERDQRWGNWDSVERYLYMDGDNVKLDCTEFKYEKIYNAQNVTCSDHSGAFGNFTYTVTSDTDTANLKLTETTGTVGITELVRRVVTFFKALVLIFNNFDQIVAELKSL